MAQPDEKFLRKLLEQVLPPKNKQYTYQKYRDIRLISTSIAVFFVIVFFGIYVLREHLIYERVNSLLSDKGLLVTGVLQEVPERPRATGRRSRTTTMMVQYTINNVFIGGRQTFRRKYTLNQVKYDFLTQSNDGVFPSTIKIQYLPQQPIISRLVIISNSGDLVDIRYKYFNNFTLGIYLFFFLFSGSYSASSVAQLAHRNREIPGTVRYRNEKIIFRRGCYVVLFVFALSVFVSAWPVDEREFIVYCQQQHMTSEWFTC